MSPTRLTVLLRKEISQSSRNYIFAFVVVVPIVLSLVVTLVFGPALVSKPSLGLLDADTSSLASAARSLQSIEAKDYASLSDMKDALENGSLDMGILLPIGIDSSLRQGERVVVDAYVWGESPAKNRATLVAALTDLARGIAGQTSALRIETVTLGESEPVPWKDRVFPAVVLVAILLSGVMVPAVAMVTEKEKKTLDALLATPATLAEILTAKGLVGVAVSLFVGLVTLAVNQAFGASPWLLVVLLAVGSIMTVEIGLVLGMLLKDWNTLFTVWKSGGIILLAPAIVYLFPQIPEWVAKVFPTYYVIGPIVEISQQSAAWNDVAWEVLTAIALELALIALLAVLVTRSQRRTS